MPDEQDTPTPEPTPQDSSPEQAVPSEPPLDAQDQEASEQEQAESLAAAMAAISQVQGVADSANTQAVGNDAAPFSSPEFSSSQLGGGKSEIDLLSDVHMDVRIELGRTRMFVEDVLKLGDGAVVELDKLAGDPVDVFVNNRRVARGEVLVLNDLFCVRINEVIDITECED